MPDFDVRYGDDTAKVDWRKYEEPDKDDDEPLAKTPKSVVDMLGFDPLDEVDDTAQASDEDGPSSVTRLSQAMMDYHALPVRIETCQGQVRTGVTADGRSWRTVMPADYGFIDAGVMGADGDQIDCYIGPFPESNNVYVVDQYGLDGKVFDEHKVILGLHTEESAEELYRDGHHLSSVTFAAITPFTMPMFRRWLRLHDMKTPCDPGVKK